MIALHITNIVVIMSLTFYLRAMISEKPYSWILAILYYILSKGKNKKGLYWFRDNPIYIFNMLLVLVLLLINLTLMGQLMRSDILTRPIFNFILSPAAWGLVLITKYLSEQKRKIA